MRLDRQQQSALCIAEALQVETGVRRVVYPGLASYAQRELAERTLRTPEGRFAPGSMVCFELDESAVT